MTTTSKTTTASSSSSSSSSPSSPSSSPLLSPGRVNRSKHRKLGFFRRHLISFGTGFLAGAWLVGTTVTTTTTRLPSATTVVPLCDCRRGVNRTKFEKQQGQNSVDCILSSSSSSLSTSSSKKKTVSDTNVDGGVLQDLLEESNESDVVDIEYLEEDTGDVDESAKRISSKRKKNEQVLHQQVEYGLLFPSSSSSSSSMSGLVHGMGRVPRGKFFQQFDTGMAMDANQEGNEEVLILYGSPHSLPLNHQELIQRQSSSFIPRYDTVKKATNRCNLLKVIYTNPKPKDPISKSEEQHKQCIAIVGQWESPYIHTFKRDISTLQRRRRTNHQNTIPPLEHKPMTKRNIPNRHNVQLANQALQAYLSAYPVALERLRPLLEQATATNTKATKDKTVIVMTANYGQFYLFMNFYCAAQARNIPKHVISRIVLFATDLETYEAATQQLGDDILCFYDATIYHAIPKHAALDYHDLNYGLTMMAKVYCVHMVNALGYDVLFQDLDIVWYRNPLTYFHSLITTSQLPASNNDNDVMAPAADIYLQYDGDHHPVQFKPLAANTGSYFVRCNERTEHFLSVFIRRGDLVLQEQSHQAAFTILATEHQSLYGLKIKVLSERPHVNLFMSGFHYHTRKQAVERLLAGRLQQKQQQPILFHVNWLTGYDKVLALQELKSWFVQPNCTVTNTTQKPLELRYNKDCCRKLPP